MADRTLILEKRKIRQKLERMAYEIIENNYNAKEILLAGINNRGLFVAKRLAEFMKNIMDIKVTVKNLKVNAANPIETEVSIDIDHAVNDQSVIIVDDVANTGRTLLYATKPFLSYLPRKIQVAVLVDRKHKTYPISADFVGLSLATTIRENIRVEVSKTEVQAVFLD